jgi:hypothetical protein
MLINVFWLAINPAAATAAAAATFDKLNVLLQSPTQE